MKHLFSLIFVVILLVCTANAQNAPTNLSATNISDKIATVNWQASITTPTTNIKIEGFEQAFGTTSWNSGGYNWVSTNTDIRTYSGTTHSGNGSLFIVRTDNRLIFNIPVTLKGLWVYPQYLTSYTIKGYSANNIELYSKTVNVSSSISYEYLTLNWSNIKAINISFPSINDHNEVIIIDDLEYSPLENVYPYYLSTVNTAPANNETASGLATGTTLNLTGLQPSTTYYVWMRTYNGNGYGNWTTSPLTFTTSAVLPITLQSFSAERKGNELYVNWKTASENNNSHFLIQASVNGSTWTNLGKVNSKATNGNSSAALSYTFTHSLSQLALAGFSLLGLLLLPATRNKFLKFAMLLLVITSITACAKVDVTSPQLDKGLTTAQSVYVRLVQVDLDGTLTYSDAVQAKK
ncbi:fibronectin type III domain-containing protein [Pedobacter montanisoli]|uniref:Fibronectin type III domain-containing protein n=1 Tax=Pedobacter montanisoli TaxID=2923277 RepID=A0ABS9ZWP6_9SPHI|nr:fibronectin type III domain-containing protein [Pedobacter montanisoli]MCJ0742718.1 fibronectin type III domain-containing protein [Pedobacter montanisoli]